MTAVAARGGLREGDVFPEGTSGIPVGALSASIRVCASAIWYSPPNPGSAGSVVEALEDHGSVLDEVAAGLDVGTRRAHAAARSVADAFAVATTTTTVASGKIGTSRHSVGQPGLSI